MKITKRQLRKIIKESMEDFGQKFDQAYKQADRSYSDQPDEFEGSMMDLEDYQRLENLLSRDLKVFLRGGYTKNDIIQALKIIIGEM